MSYQQTAVDIPAFSNTAFPSFKPIVGAGTSSSSFEPPSPSVSSSSSSLSASPFPSPSPSPSLSPFPTPSPFPSPSPSPYPSPTSLVSTPTKYPQSQDTFRPEDDSSDSHVGYAIDPKATILLLDDIDDPDPIPSPVKSPNFGVFNIPSINDIPNAPLSQLKNRINSLKATASTTKWGSSPTPIPTSPPSITPVSTSSPSILLTDIAPSSSPSKSSSFYRARRVLRGLKSGCISFWEGLETDLGLAKACRKPFHRWVLQGIVVRSILVLLTIIFFTILILMVEIPEEKPPLKILSLEDFIYSELQPRELNIKWAPNSPDFISWLNKDKQTISGYNITTHQQRTIIDGKNHLSKPLKRRIKISDYSISPNYDFVLIAVDVDMVWDGFFYANYLIHSLNESTNIWLGSYRESPGIANAQWSTDGFSITFTLDNDVYLYDLFGSTYKRITYDGFYPNVLNGRMSWIYQNELFNNHNAIWWSPTSLKFAFFKTDETSVVSVPIHTFHDDYTGSIQIKYPMTYSSIPTVSLVVYDLQTGISQTMSIEQEYITSVIWLSDNELFYRTMNRNQNREYYTVYNFTSFTAFKFLSQEEPDVGWLALKDVLYIGADELVMIKNHSGYYHLHLYNLQTGTLLAYLSNGEWDVTSIVGFDITNRLLYYTSNKDVTTEQHIYAVLVPSFLQQNLSRTFTHFRLFEENGFYGANFNWKGSAFVMNYEGPDIPHQVLYSTVFTPAGNGGEVPVLTTQMVRRLEDNSLFEKKIQGYFLPKKVPVSFPSADGSCMIGGEILLPNNFNPSKQYPLLIHVDGTPERQSIVAKWAFGFDEFIVSNLDVVVLRLDPTGSGGRGTEFLFKTYKKLGKSARLDYVSAIQSLLSDTYAPVKIDPLNIGIWGTNVGGHIALSLLIQNPELFKAGIILDPIANWLLYNAVFTERYMSSPLNNPVGYNETNVLNLVPTLTEAKFLLIHGTEYHEVYSQNTARLKKLLAYQGLKYQTISCADWPEDDKAHFYKLVITYLTATLTTFKSPAPPVD